MAKTVNLTINGVKVAVPEGTLVVDAAKRAGIDVPVFCYHPKMEPVGMCRQCLVEIGRPMIDRATGQHLLDEHGQPKLQFMPKPETACTNPVSEGMVVYTESEKARDGQKTILELLLTSHPLDCPVCDKGGECPLQNLTMAHGPSESRFLYDEKQHAAKHVPLGELIFLDRERCIQCARCIRFQDEIAGEPVLGFYQRGRATDIVTYSEPGFDSLFSGNTTDICPVGALTTADFRFGARPWELKPAASVCSQCPVGCNITFNVRREVKSGGEYVIKRVMPRQNEEVNEIWMCDKGRFSAHHFTQSPERLTEAFAKQSGTLVPIPLDAALGRVADKLAAAKDGTVILAGGRLSNEDLFNLKQLAGGLGGRALLDTTMGGGEFTAAYGLGAGSNLGELGKGTTILVVASDLHDEAPVWYLRVKAAARRGAALIVAGARSTKLEEYASFVVRYAYGDEVETVKSLPKKDKIGEALANAGNLVVFYGSDGLGVEGSEALASVCADLVKSRAGKPNSGLVGVWSRANAQGAWELGYQPSTDLVSELKGKAVYVVAADPVGDDPALAEAFKGAAFVAVQELFLTKTAALADVVLPAQAYTEREGTFTSAERRVQRFLPSVPAHPPARTNGATGGTSGPLADFALTAAIARRCGIELEGRSPLLVMNKISASVEAFAGITYAKLAEVSEQWPVIGRADLYYGGTTYENKQGLGAHLSLVKDVALPSPPMGKDKSLRPKEDELLAVPISKAYDRGTTMLPAELLHSRIGEAGVVLNPVTAKKLGLDPGTPARVNLNGVTRDVVVRLDESVATGVVLVPRSFGIPLSAPAPVKLTIPEKA
jgi:NADH-quinone oxidoreductase subunit G